MGVTFDTETIADFEAWYTDSRVEERTGARMFNELSPTARNILSRFDDAKREMDARCQGFEKLELLADGQVLAPKPDLPNVSSGETAGLIRRIARNLVQNTPNVEVLNEFDEESHPYGIVARHLLLTKIIGSDEYSNDMQQNLFASTKSALTVGFDCVIPCLVQNAAGEWVVEYDPIHYRDVFPDPGVKEVRKAPEVFIRRYLSKGELVQLVRDQVEGWDEAAIRALLERYPRPPLREPQSASIADKTKKLAAQGYELITWYSNSGAAFLTYNPQTKLLLRIEKNLHPLRQHPVFFLVLEKDNPHPLGKAQVELLLGRQDFQDLMHNGAMKLWYRNINPSIIGYGTVNAAPNLTPGKFTAISNPNARVETFEVSTQTLLQYSPIAQQNLANMTQLVGATDQQMAAQAGAGMSATPQGVEAQQQMVDITTNNYQKAIESFFSHYCSYALTIYCQELKGVKKLVPSAETRRKLLDAGLSEEMFDEKGGLKFNFSDMARVFYVRCIPGSLVELEDEKQLRILNQLFVPLSQAMPAIAATQDQQAIANAVAAIQFIVSQEIELSGSNRARELQQVFDTGKRDSDTESRVELEQQIGGAYAAMVEIQERQMQENSVLRQQISDLAEITGILAKRMGMDTNASETNSPEEPIERT